MECQNKIMQRGNILIYLLIGIFILGGVAGGYYLGTKKSSNPVYTPTPTPVVNSQTPQPIASPVPTAKPDEIANWKTYTNKVGYSLKYPPNFIASPPGQNVNDIILYFPQDASRDYYFGSITVTVRDLPANVSIPAAIEKGYSGLGSYPSSTIQFQNTTVDGQPALENSAPSQFYAYDAHFIKNGKIYGIRLQTNTGTKQPVYEENVFNQILSTFKFTN